MFNPISLKNRIQAAKTVEEVSGLLEEGDNYSYASDHTRNQWQRIAVVQTNRITGGEPKKEEKRTKDSQRKKRKHRRKQ